MADEDSDLIWEPMWVGRRPGTHYSSDGSSPLLRSDFTNHLETQAVLGGRVEDDERDPSENEDDEASSSGKVVLIALGIAVGVVATIGAIKAAPHVKSWLQDLKSKRSGRPVTNETDSPPATYEMVALSATAYADFSGEVDAALEDHRARMSSEEAQKRLLAILMAAAFIADQMRALSSARIDDGASRELESAMAKLTVPNLTDSVNRMLEANASLLDLESSAELMRLFGGGRLVDGQYVPLRNEKVKEALRLPG